MTQTWKSEEYAREGRFVAELAGPLMDLLDPKPGERILDLGCGDGFLTERIAGMGASVVGIDSSPSMVKAARMRGLEARLGDAAALGFAGEFDAVFSNAALHWMPDQDAVLDGVGRALKPGGRLVAEMGGSGNIAAIRVALLAALTRRGISAERVEVNHFFSVEEYSALLERHRFRAAEIHLTPRPTPLPAGMASWLAGFRRGLLDELPAENRQAAIDETVALLRPVLQDSQGNWTADYVRLRFKAIRDSNPV